MFDIHAHILPGLDDGPQDLNESLAMLRLAREYGTGGIAATPHANPMYRYEPDTADRLALQLQHAIGANPKIYPGCDFHLMYDNVADAVAHPGKYALARRTYLLVELSDLIIFPNTEDSFHQLEHAGYHIIITHPERNPILQKSPERITRWIDQGRMMQVTAGSLFGRFGRRAESMARRMLDQGQVHFVASDAHDTRHRPPRLDEAYAWVAERYGETLAGLLFREHPFAALEGVVLDLGSFPPPRPPKRRWWTSWLGQGKPREAG